MIVETLTSVNLELQFAKILFFHKFLLAFVINSNFDY